MIEGLGETGTTPLHRLPAGAKFAGLAVIATALFFVASVPVLVAALGAALAVALSTGRGAADRKSTRLNSSHIPLSRMPSSA